MASHRGFKRLTSHEALARWITVTVISLQQWIFEKFSSHILVNLKLLSCLSTSHPEKLNITVRVIKFQKILAEKLGIIWSSPWFLWPQSDENFLPVKRVYDSFHQLMSMYILSALIIAPIHEEGLLQAVMILSVHRLVHGASSDPCWWESVKKMSLVFLPSQRNLGD